MANVIWSPQPKQREFQERPEYEVLYGGAAGGGKSDALLMEALRQVDNPDYRGIIFRKTFPQLAELIDRSLILYKAAFPRARYNDGKHVWVFPSGAKIFFASMQHSKDKTNYQGKRYDFIGFDELTHFTWEEYSYMFSRNRPSKRPRSTKKTICYIRATTNPGGVGHGWVKERFIDAAEPGQTIVEIVEVTMPDGSKRKIKRDRVFIQATIFDNQALLDNDPGYLGSLALLPEKERDLVFEINTLMQDNEASFVPGETWKLHIEDLKTGYPDKKVLARGEWNFDIPITEDCGDFQEIELVSEPITTKASTGWRADGSDVMEDVKLTSFKLRAMSASYSVDQEYAELSMMSKVPCVVMKDGSKFKIYGSRTDAPIDLDQADYVELIDGTKLPVPQSGENQ